MSGNWVAVALCVALLPATHVRNSPHYVLAMGDTAGGTGDYSGTHSHRGITLQGPALSVDFFLEDVQLIDTSSWSGRNRREVRSNSADNQ